MRSGMCVCGKCWQVGKGCWKVVDPTYCCVAKCEGQTTYLCHGSSIFTLHIASCYEFRVLPKI